MSLNQTCAIWVQVADTGHPLTARFDHAATVFFNGTTDLVFVYGGRNAQADALGDLFVCDSTAQTCHQRLVDGDVPTPRSAVGAAQVGHRLVLFGGLLQTSASSSAATGSNNANSNAFSLLDVLREPANWADRQQVLERAPVYRQRALWEAGWGRGVIPVSRQATTVTESGRDILFFGGDVGGGRFSRCVFQYEFELSTWSLAFQPPNNARCTDEAAAGPPADPGGRASASAVPYGAHDALLFGGSRYTANTVTDARIHLSDDLWLFRSDTSSWQLLGNGSSSRASSAWPSPRDGHAMSVAPAWMANQPAYLLYGGRGCSGARTSCSPRDARLLGDAWLLSIGGNAQVQWQRLRLCANASALPTPTARAFHTLSTVNNEAVMLVGGLGEGAVLGDVWSLQWQTRPPDASALPAQHVPIASERTALLYLVLYLPALSWYAPEQFTTGIDGALQAALQQLLHRASIEYRQIYLWQVASGGKSDHGQRVRGTLAQYAVWQGAVFVAETLQTLRAADADAALSEAAGTPVQLLQLRVGSPASMQPAVLFAGAAVGGSTALSPGLLALVISLSAAVALAIALLLYLVYRRRMRRAHRKVSLWAELGEWSGQCCCPPALPSADESERQERTPQESALSVL